jgi:hypothetical protein
MSKLIRTPSGRTVLANSKRELRETFTLFGIVARRDPSPNDPDYEEIHDLRAMLLRWGAMRPDGTLDWKRIYWCEKQARRQ